MADRVYPYFRPIVQIHYVIEGAEGAGSTVVSHMLNRIPSDSEAAVDTTRRVLDALMAEGLLDLTAEVPSEFLPEQHRTPRG